MTHTREVPAFRRRFVNAVMLGLLGLAAIVSALPLLLIIFHLLREGIGALSVDFFIHTPKPVGDPGGGMANAMVGTLVIIVLASTIGLPVGVGAGLYLTEYRGAKFATAVRFLSDVLNGLPSVVIGIF